MVIETWRWRFVILCLGLGLLWTGGYCLLHPGYVLLNICDSPTSVFLHNLNLVLTFVVFVIVAVCGLLLIYLVWYSAARTASTERDKKPIDYRAAGRSALAYIVILIALGLCVVLLQWALRSTSLGSRRPAIRDHVPASPRYEPGR